MRVLSDLEVGESGVLVTLDLPPGVQNHLMYMGFVPDAHVKALHRAPAGDPTVYAVDGIEIAIRRETARSIRVAPIGPASRPASESAQANPQPAVPEPVTEPVTEPVLAEPVTEPVLAEPVLAETVR